MSRSGPITPMTRPANLPAQREPTEETPQIPRTKAPLFVVLGALVLAGVGAAFAFGGASAADAVPAAVVIPTPVDVAVPTLQPVAVPKVEAPVVPPPDVKVEAPVAAVEPPPVEPVAAKVEPVAAKVEAVKPAKASAPKLSRGEKILRRLTKLEQLVPAGSNDEKLLTKLRAGLNGASGETLDQLQSAVDALETKYKE